MKRFDPKAVRYIKLGPGGRWVARCFDRGELHFGYPGVPHELCQVGDWDGVVRHFTEGHGKSLAKARDAAREIRDFYTLGGDCLWFTLEAGRLWWTFADLAVIWLGGDGEAHGQRMRRTISGWQDTDVSGKPLRADRLSSRLTQLSAYRQTICSVKAEAYLLRRIKSEDEPIIAKAEAARSAVVLVAQEMIAGLHWADFEVLVDLLFARTGWQRISGLGGTIADIDLALFEPASGDRAFVQVKSQADQSTLENYIHRFDEARIYSRMFFVCHSPKGELRAPDRQNLHVWTGKVLAAMAVKTGLYDWLMERSS